MTTGRLARRNAIGTVNYCCTIGAAIHNARPIRIIRAAIPGHES